MAAGSVTHWISLLHSSVAAYILQHEQDIDLD
jgi:hypothetical protein